MIEFKTLSTITQHEYDLFVKECEFSSFFHSVKYKTLLNSILIDATEMYLLFYSENQLIAALPLFKKNGRNGVVFNSLPFFGSHGGLLYKNKINDVTLNQIATVVINLLTENNYNFFTAVEPLFSPNNSFYDGLLASVEQKRIGQITYLPSSKSKFDINSDLLQYFPGKRRWDIKKGLNQGFRIFHSGEESYFLELFNLHVENMQMINGTAKPKIMFEKIPEIFQYDLDYRLYIAEYDSKVVAALLIFFFKDQVEYFLPVIHKDFRSYQPLSALIYTAMADSIKDKESKVWNWGGTWATQDTLYRFKKSWNAHDKEYRYHIKTNLSSTVLRGINFKEAILEFQNFYLYPVSEEYYD